MCKCLGKVQNKELQKESLKRILDSLLLEDYSVSQITSNTLSV